MKFPPVGDFEVRFGLLLPSVNSNQGHKTFDFEIKKLLQSFLIELFGEMFGLGIRSLRYVSFLWMDKQTDRQLLRYNKRYSVGIGC